MRSLSHPANDPKLPSFQHPCYQEFAEDLKLAWDVWHELKGCKKEYLPQEEKERPKAYQNRLKRTQFDGRFTPALKGHAGLLSEFSLLEKTAQSIRDAEDNIDLQGTSLTTFLTEVDEMVLRDGGCGILVDFPVEPTDEQGNSLVQSAADQQALELRPYLVAIDRRNILNWRLDYVQGKPVIQFLVLREKRLVPDGAFGVAERTLYRVLRPGRFEVYELKPTSAGWTPVLIEEGQTGLSQVPFIWYSVSHSKWFESAPPFLNLARLNIEHFQKRSSLNEVLHKCNLPVPVRKGAVVKGASDKQPVPPLVIGPNSVVDVPIEGDFYFAEPTGAAIAATQADIGKLEGSMDRVSLAFLTGGEAAKTATEVVMDSSQTQCSLKNMARRKESAVQAMFALWTVYTGEESGSGIKVNESVLQAPANPQEVQIILDAMGVKISNRLGLEMLIARKWMPAGTDLDEEVKRLEGLEQQSAQPLTTPEAIDREGNLTTVPTTA